MSSATANDVINDVRTSNNASLPAMLGKSLPAAFRKFSPAKMRHNPVMFVVFVGAIVTTVLAIVRPSVFAWAIAAALYWPAAIERRPARTPASHACWRRSSAI